MVAIEALLNLLNRQTADILGSGRGASITIHARGFERTVSNMTSLSVVVPAYNEEEGLLTFHRRLVAVLDGIDMAAEIIYVNDGSRIVRWPSCTRFTARTREGVCSI